MIGCTERHKRIRILLVQASTSDHQAGLELLLITLLTQALSLLHKKTMFELVAGNHPRMHNA